MTDNGAVERPAQEVQALFLVVIDLDGQSRAVFDPDARFTAQRVAVAQDVYPACANILADYQAIKTAEAILSFQTQIARQMQSQAVDKEKTP